MRGLNGAVIACIVAVLVGVVFYLRGGGSGSEAGQVMRPGSGTRVASLPQVPSRRMDRGWRSDGSEGGQEQQRGGVGHGYEGGSADLGRRRLFSSSGQLAGSNPQPNKRDVPGLDRRQQAEQDDDGDSEDDDGDAEDPQELEELKQTLFSDPDPDERIGAVLMLTGDEGAESMRMLLEAMDDPDPEVRLAVVEALGDRAEELSPASLRGVVHDPDPEVRYEALSALGDIKTVEARQMVQAAKQDPDEDVRDLAQEILDDQDDDGDAPGDTAPQQAPTPAPAHGLTTASK
jgi:hypothetical protein